MALQRQSFAGSRGRQPKRIVIKNFTGALSFSLSPLSLFLSLPHCHTHTHTHTHTQTHTNTHTHTLCLAHGKALSAPCAALLQRLFALSFPLVLLCAVRRSPPSSPSASPSAATTALQARPVCRCGRPGCALPSLCRLLSPRLALARPSVSGAARLQPVPRAAPSAPRPPRCGPDAAAAFLSAAAHVAPL